MSEKSKIDDVTAAMAAVTVSDEQSTPKKTDEAPEEKTKKKKNKSRGGRKQSGGGSGAADTKKKETRRGGRWASVAGAKLTTRYEGDELKGNIEVSVNFGDPGWERKLTEVYTASLMKVLREHNRGPEWSIGQVGEWVARRVYMVKQQHEAEEAAEAAAAAAAAAVVSPPKTQT